MADMTQLKRSIQVTNMKKMMWGVVSGFQRNFIFKSRLLGLSVIMILMISGLSVKGQTTYLEEDFTGTSASNWEFITGLGTGAVLTASAAMPEAERDAVGDGWLRLTHDIRNQASFVYYDEIIPSTNGLIFSFDFAIWTENSTAADGFTLAIFSPTNAPGAGGYGGSLGYAQRYNIEGLNGALVGFGFDAFGNFSNPTEDRVGGPGRRSNSIAVRGPMGEDRDSGYEYVTGTASLQEFYSTKKTSRDDVVIHSARIAISPDKTVSVAWTDDSGTWQSLIWQDCDLPCPDNVMIGFTAGTGGVSANQEVRNLEVTSYEGESMIWDGGSETGAGWGSETNWVDDGLPPFDSETDLVFSALDSDQLTNYLETSRIVRSLSFSSNTLGDVTIRTSTTASGTEGVDMIFSASGDGAAIMVPTVSENDYLIGDGAGSLILSNNLLVAQQGIGNLTLGSPVNGPEGVTKRGSGTLVLSNTNSYEGDTILMEGTVRLVDDGSLGSPGNDLTIWDGTMDLGGTTQTNMTVTIIAGTLTNGTLSSSSRFHYYTGDFDATLTGNGGLDKWDLSSTLTLSHANSYAGSTVVRAGTLLVNNSSGSGTGTGAVSVNNAAVLGGDGTISGAMTVASGGIVAPGEANYSVGTLQVGGDVTFESDATFAVEIGSGTSCDKLDLMGTGGLALGSGAATLDIGILSEDSYIIVSSIKRDGLTGIFKDASDNLLTDGAELPLQPGYYIHYVNNSDSDDGYIEINTTPVPADLYGYLFIDKNSDQIRNTGDVTITNAQVSLIIDGIVYSNTYTDVDGFYNFVDLPVGVVTVQVVQADATLAVVPSTNDVMRNRGVFITGSTNTAIIAYTVTSGYGVLSTNPGEPLNFGYDDHPLSTRIDIRVYATSDGRVMIDLYTVNENGNNDIEIYAMINGEWVMVAMVPSEQIEGGGDHKYTVDAFGLTPGQSYMFKIVDESGHIFYTGDPVNVAKAQLRALVTSLSPEYFTMTFNTEPFGWYMLMVSESLSGDAGWTSEYVQVVHPAFPDGVSDYSLMIQGAPDGTTTLRVPQNRDKAFFKLIKVE